MIGRECIRTVLEGKQKENFLTFRNMCGINNRAKSQASGRSGVVLSTSWLPTDTTRKGPVVEPKAVSAGGLSRCGGNHREPL